MIAPMVGGFMTAMVLSFALTFGLRRVAHHMGMVDRPDGGRKAHARATPTVGGVGLYLSAATTLGLGALLGVPAIAETAPQLGSIEALAAGATVIFLLGVVDDIRGLGPWTKLFAQLVVAGGLILAGVRIDSFGPPGQGFVVPAVVGVPLTMAWIVGITNSFNLLDGSDGVAGGAALFALLTVGLVSWFFGKDAVAVISFVLAGATLGFLFFNFPPASIFLGDSGSLLLGFSLASMGVIATQKAPTVLAIAIPLTAFGVPILDTSLTVVRRFLRREAIFRPDRGHIHHRLREMGHSPRAVAFIVYLLTAGLCVLSLILAGGQTTVVGVGFALMGVVVVVFVQRLRIPELLELGKMVNWGRLQRVVIERNMRVRAAAAGLEEARSPREVVRALQGAFDDGEFTRLELWLEDDYAGVMRDERWVEWDGGVCRVRLSLMPSDVLQEVELRLDLDVPGRDPAGRLALFRPVDGSRILTDLTVIVEELQPALLQALERLVAARGDETGPAGTAQAGGSRGERTAGAAPEPEAVEEAGVESVVALPRAASG